MKCYRIARKKYASKLSGEGAKLFGGRWNTKGNSIIYTAQTSSLAMLEMLVQRSVQLIGMDYYLITIYVPDDMIIQSLGKKELPLAWNTYPPNDSTKHIGDRFIDESKGAILAVPSAVNPLEVNYLINDQHRDFYDIEILEKEQIIFDKRLVLPFFKRIFGELGVIVFLISSNFFT